MRLLEEVRHDLELAQLVVAPAALAIHAASASSSASATNSTSSIGSWRKRAPIVRKVSGSPVVRKR